MEKIGSGADVAAEAVVAAAARRGGEISRAGRESSLSADADALLSAAVRCLSAPKAGTAVLPNVSWIRKSTVGSDEHRHEVPQSAS